MARNKIIYNGNTLIDLTGDTVTASGLLQGLTAHDRRGDVITGTLESGQPNIRYCQIELTSGIGGSTGSHIIPLPAQMTGWLSQHYASPGITVSLAPRFQIMQQYSVLSSWATTHYVLGVTTYGLAAYNGTTSSAIGTVSIRSQSDSLLADCKSNFAIRLNAEGAVSVWFNSAQYWIRPGKWVVTAWCD